MIAIKNYEEVGEARLNRAKMEVNKIFKNKLELDKIKDQEQYIEIDELNKLRNERNDKNADEFLKIVVSDVKKNVELLELADKLLLESTKKGRVIFTTGDKEIREYKEKTLRVKNNMKNLLQKIKKKMYLYSFFDNIDISEIRSELQDLDKINKTLINKFTSLVPAQAVSPQSRQVLLEILKEISNYIEEIYNIISGGGSQQEHFIKVGGSKLYNTSITLDNYKYV